MLQMIYKMTLVGNGPPIDAEFENGNDRKDTL